MAEILITSPPDVEETISLEPGRYAVGSAEGADIQLEDDAVLGAHCELVVDPVAVRINTLDPRAAVSLNGESVSSSVIPPGALVAVGSYQFQVLGGAGEVVRPSFGSLVRDAFIAPFSVVGLATIVAGAVGLTLTGAVLGWVPIMGMVVSLGIMGYVFAFAQSILTSAAHGEDRLPNWPGLEGGPWDVFGPAFQFIGVLLFLFGPTVAVSFFLPTWWPLSLTLALAGLAFMPIALMAVTLMGSLAVMLNPPALMQAVYRIRGHYTVVLVILLTTLCAFVAYQVALEHLLPIPVVPDLLARLVHLYLLIVWMKLIGSLYYLHSERLGWSG